MDADLQHPPEKVIELIEMIGKSRDFVIGTRYAATNSIDKDWPLYRRVISSGARMLARPLSPLSDPMTGFFALSRRAYARGGPYNPVGFKICLEMFVKVTLVVNERHKTNDDGIPRLIRKSSTFERDLRSPSCFAEDSRWVPVVLMIVKGAFLSVAGRRTGI
jgi:glycosyltransferase involved in cell wall biosynthesis